MVRNCLTVDVEEWFHICGVGALSREHWDSLPSRVVQNTRQLLDLLDRHHVRGTFFVLGWVAERYPRLVQEIASAGHEIASEGWGAVTERDLLSSTLGPVSVGCRRLAG